VFDFLGNHGVVRWKGKRFWAENGLVRCEDSADNSYTVTPVRRQLHRIRAVHDMLGRSEGFIAQYHDQVVEHQNFVDDMIDVCRRAQVQGMPEDPSASSSLARSLPKSVSMSGSSRIRELPSSLDAPVC